MHGLVKQVTRVLRLRVSSFDQHIESFDHLINVEMKQIVMANQVIRCDADPNFRLM